MCTNQSRLDITENVLKKICKLIAVLFISFLIFPPPTPQAQFIAEICEQNRSTRWSSAVCLQVATTF